MLPVSVLSMKSIRAAANYGILRECSSSKSVLCGVKNGFFKANATATDIDALKRDFYRLVSPAMDVSRLCPNVSRFGHSGYGGYDLCMLPSIRPTAGNCLVYSFGISTDWSFDEAFANYLCEVHSFDPSIGLKDHIHSPGVFFHNLGLWGSDILSPENWTLLSLSTIRHRLGHEQRLIDVLKVDVEIAEWPFLRDMIIHNPSTLSHVRQFILEVHTPKYRSQALDAPDLAEINYYFQQLTNPLNRTGGLGFAVYGNRHELQCCDTFAGLLPSELRENCCYELSLLNTRFLTGV